MLDSFESWLKSLETDLSRRIKDSRRYPTYVDEVICNTEKFYIWKKSGRDTIKREGDVTIIWLAPLQSGLISPIPIRVSVPGDWRNWYEGRTIMDIYIGDVCRYVATREEQIVIETLSKDVKVFGLDSEVFTRDQLREPVNYISSQGNFADTLLVHPLQLPKLIEEKGFVPKWNLPRGIVDKKGLAFIGLMGALSIYETIGVSESTGLLYEKRQIKIRKTPLSIKFDDYDHPRTLNVIEYIFAWTVDDGAIAKISLKTE